ncbi:uncharacterized protein A1O9_02168 [Exophiala aquamarina CBS 119918]|uniref:Zn(2)-C6 fungal-type domain-containing protein n=1 Tax=Exophiala aquamarina CBS 119918 TaxID=1182545 RepID=A0A072PLH5_9EURO|nr:uncharacterized protein A1O9_02168 [Exophiala aquamarina CBS 119918]KEF60607.1 hypothetical protein A1O9_02168 [Exophiala aquamarina CBS 119918]
MVNRGRSGGCVTCKQRRVKCDEAKPDCWLCRNLRLRCGGYKTNFASLKFKDQNHKFYGAFALNQTRENQDQTAVSIPPLPSEPDSAVSFFLGHYANIGRHVESARGFYEVLVPVYCSQKQGSALSLAVSALASRILSLWRHIPGDSGSPQEPYAQAIASLRSALQNRDEVGKPQTLLAVLTLQLYENIIAIYGFRVANGIHHNGAVSLLRFAESGVTDETINGYLCRFVLHTEISSAKRQKRPLQSLAYSWFRSKSLKATPNNPSSALDVIGASIAELHDSYSKLSKKDGSATSSSLRDVRNFKAEAKSIDQQLLAWARSVPGHWLPQRLTSGHDIDSSIPTYRSVCEIYLSCQIANIWNLWRLQRLLLVKIYLGLLDTIYCHRFSESAREQTSGRIDDYVECKQITQELVDSVCHSIPFYLGNLTKPLSMNDFTDPTILLPSYNSVAQSDKTHFSKQKHGHGMSKDEYKRQIIAQGPWHAMSPLSRLLTHFSEDLLMSGFLRPGQYAWIQEQFLRVITLLRLFPTESGDGRKGYCVSNSLTQRSVDTTAEYLATEVRKGAIFMSGP